MFNTLAYAKMLEEVGFSREQAETSIRILVEIMEDKLATKQDIRELASATQRDIQELKASTQHDLRELESRLTLRVGTMLAASVTLLTAVVTAIHKFV